jgi:RNA polymerase sigma factor (sigma-70 family)
MNHRNRSAASRSPQLEGSGAVRLMARVAGGQRQAQLELIELIGLEIQRTLQRVVGCDAPIDELLEAALLGAVERAREYHGEESLALWAQRSAVQVATGYLRRVPSPPNPLGAPSRVAANGSESVLELPPKVRDLFVRVREILRSMRPEEQVAFALLDLDGRSLAEASALLRASPVVVRQRASRARRHLLFAARSDRRIAAYVRLAERLRGLAVRVRSSPRSPLASDNLRRVQGRVFRILSPGPH